MDITLKANTLDIRGTITLENPPAGGSPGRYVFQRVGQGFGNLPGGDGYDMQIRRHVIPADPQTPAQLARRAAFAAAVASWHAATPEERETARQLAESRGITLFNAWLSINT